MKDRIDWQKVIEFVGVIFVWFLIFGFNAFSHLLFVDYVPREFGYLWRDLVITNFATSVNILSLLGELFALLNLEGVFFSFAILLAMLVSYYYISRLIDGNKRIFFGLIFFLSPFVYARIMIGQIGILVAYLLMPMFLFYLVELFSRDLNYISLLKMSISMMIIGSIAPHFFVFCFILFLVGSFWFYFYKNKFEMKKYAKMFRIFTLLLILLNWFWLQGLFANSVLGKIDSEHEEFFAPKASGGISAIVKTIGMWGFWREEAHANVYGLIPSFVWHGLIAILVALLLIGYYGKEENRKSKFFYTLFWMGLIFGVGISHPYTGHLFDWFFNNVPFFKGFRDSNKFVTFLALAYAYLLPDGIEVIKDKLKLGRAWRVIIILLFVALIIGMNFTIINLYGQARNVDYPSSYYKVNEFLMKKKIDGRIIYLPWQTYLTYSWSLNVSSDGRISVPILEIFSFPVQEGPDQLGGGDKFTLDVSECLKEKDTACLKNSGVTYVLNDKCALYPEKYDWVTGEKEFETDCIDVYYLGGKSKNNELPLRFVFSLALSIVSLIFALLLASNRK